MTKFVFTFVLLWGIGTAEANDVTCESSMMRPQLQIAVPANLQPTEPTVVASASLQAPIQEPEEVVVDMVATEDNKAVEKEPKANVVAEPADTKPSEKSSTLGGMFDILLPSKLRNPAK